MKIRSLIILLVLACCLVPLVYLNRVLKQKIQPRRSMGRLGLYLLVAVGFVFVYTGLIVFVTVHLFPVAKK